MPLIRYELRNEHEIANPELRNRVVKTDARALFESITMCALAGLVRQLGELSEFAAELFGDLHDEIMAISRRGRKLYSRVEKLEAKVPTTEEFLFMETDQLRFAFVPSLEWTSSVCIEQSHFTRGELPSFIKKSYDDSNGPPRFYLLDKFDMQGPGASLKRYTDPSFFRREWAKSHLLEPEDSTRTKAKKESRRKADGPSMTLRSLLETSKFIHSVRRLEDSYTEPDLELKQMRRHSRTLKISAAEIEATLLGKSPGGNSGGPLMSSESLDHFVDALATIDMEASKEAVSTTETKMGQDEILETTRTEARVSTSNKTSSSSVADSPVTMSELSTDSELLSHGIAPKESHIYSSTSSSFSSPDSPEFHASASSSSPGSDEPNRTFSALEAPMSPMGPSDASSVLSSIFSSMRELLPASPTPAFFNGTQSLQDCMPPPPPLPPLKWRLSKSPGTVPIPPPPPVPASSSPGAAASEHRDLLLDAIACRSLDKLKKASTRERARSFDSRDVLLEQIRARSFHLKQTAAQEKNEQSRPSTPSDTNVAAILEKATAIRQALEGSEDDDEW